MASKGKKAKVRKLCEKGKFKALLSVVTTEDLRQGFMPDLTQPLHYFAARGNIQAVRNLIETHKCNPACQNVHGITPLHCASYCGRFRVVKCLVDKHKCDANARDKEGACPLAYAAFCVMGNDKLACPLDVFQKHIKPHTEHFKTAKFLLSHSTVQTASLTSELCFLRLSACCGSFVDFKLIESIMKDKFGAGVPEFRSEVTKCLEIAIEQRKSDVAEYLLRTYANSIKEAVKSDTGQSCTYNVFHKACFKADFDFIKMFFELDICKPDVMSVAMAICRRDYELVQFLLQSADHPLLMDKFKSWSCMLSYIFDRLKHDQKLIKLVVDATVNTDVRDAEGNTPLHLFCKYDHLEYPNHGQAVFYYTDTDTSDSESNTPVHVTCDNIITERYDCYQSVLNSNHELPLHIACSCNSTDLELIKLVSSQLEEAINAQDFQGNTPLHVACKSTRDSVNSNYLESLTDCLKYFIHEKKCDINIQNNLGELPLHIFLKRKAESDSSIPRNLYNMKRKVVIEMIASDQCYRISAQDSIGNTPLHIACKSRDSESVLYLLSKFLCDLNATNNFGKSPLHIACENMLYYLIDNDKKKVLDGICGEQIINLQDNEGNTALHIACKEGDSVTALYLTSKFQCDLDLLNSDHCLPLHYAVSCFDDSVALELAKSVSECTLTHVQNSSGMTPLHIACKNGDIDVVKYLVFEIRCSPRKFRQSSDIYDTLEIHLACEDKNNIDLLLALANEQNVNNKCKCKLYYDEVKAPIQVACENNNLLAVKVLLELNCDILCKDLQGRLPFHIACSQSLEYVKVMSPYITDDVLNACDENGNTPLHLALANDLLDIVEYLLSTFQSDLSIENVNGELPLHIACRTTLQIVRVIMERSTPHNISVNCQTTDCDSPLHIACKFGVLDIVRYLTESFDCNPSMRLRNNEGMLPVDYACEHSLEMVKLVIQSCTVKDLVSQEYESVKYATTFDHYYNSRPTPLDIACKSGFLDTVKYLVKEKGFSLSALKNNHSALVYACGLLHCRVSYERSPCAQPEIVRFLIDECGYNSDITFQGISLFQQSCQINSLELMKTLPIHMIDSQDQEGNTPLHSACKNDCADIVKYLVDRGCNQNIVNSKGELSLHIACRSSLQVTELLTNCDINLMDADNHTPLHIACRSMKVDIVLHLIEKMKCDVKIKNNKGESALHIASLNSLQVKCLVEKSDINCQNDYGDTPLHNACYMRDSDMIQFLLSYQECRTDILNKDGDSALHVFLNDNWTHFIYSNFSKRKTLVKKLYNRPHKKSIKSLPQIVKLILKRFPAVAIITNDDGLTSIDMAIMDGELELFEILLNFGEIDDVTRKTLLHIACKHGRSEIVRWLIKHGASTEVTDDDFDFPQHICFRCGYSCLNTLKELGPLDICKQDRNNDTILHLACKMRGEHVLKFVLLNQTQDRCKIAFSIQNINKETPLHLLAASGIGSAETLALIECESPNSKDKSGNTPLHVACQHRYYELAEHLLTNCRCDSNITNDKGELPLHLAVAQSQRKIIEILDNPENVNKCNKSGDSPLHIACRSVDGFDNDNNLYSQINRSHKPLLDHKHATESLDVVKLVATSNNANMQNNDGDAPLHIACRSNNLDIALYLIKELKCSLEILNKNSESAFHILFNNWSYNQKFVELQKSVLLYIPQHINNITNKDGDTLLHIACGKADQHAVVYLVKTLRCKIDAVNKYSGATALHFACNRGSLKVVKLVSQSNPTAQICNVSYLPKEMEFVSGDTPLHIACRKGDVNVIRHLLRSGHSKALNYCNILQELPIHLAIAANQSYSLINLFIAHKKCFDCNATTGSNGDTPLHILCRHKPSAFLVKRAVHKLKCQVYVQNNEGNLPLHIACQHKYIRKGIFKMLCDALSDDQIKHRNKNGNTVLHEFLIRSELNGYFYFESSLQVFIDRSLLPLESNDSQFLEYLHLACRHQNRDIIQYLCEKYISPSLEIPMSILYEACLNCNKGVLNFILEKFEHYFDVNDPNADGDLPLHLAVGTKVCGQSISGLLVEKTKDINHKNNLGETPLHVLYSRGDTESFRRLDILNELLKTESIDLSAVNKEGATPLHCMFTASKFDDLKSVLKEREIDANLQDKKGVTLLHLACQANNFEAVNLILTSTAADPSIEDHKKQTPITLTTDLKIMKLLIEQGADPQSLYVMHKAFFERNSCEKPPQTPVKLLVIGYPSVGKTTLIQSLQNELSDKVVSEEFNHTAGIVTTNFSSQHYGVVTFYDFAGQAEYYASHDAVLHSTIKNVPPIVLILVNLNEPTRKILKQISYWINLMANRCSGLRSEVAHLILVGSHADILESHGRNPSEKVLQLHKSVTAQLEKNNIILKGTVHLNCTRSESNEMSKLQLLLQQSTRDLREKGIMDFNSHCFYVFLLQMFNSNNVATLGRVLSSLKSKSKDLDNSPLFALPSDRPKVIEMCHDLNEKGHIMFIEHPTIIDMSWLILDKSPLLHEILGSLFSPTDFPQHCPLSYSTGVVSLSRFDKHFSTKLSYPSTLSLAFLSRMEYCREIKDPLVLKSIVQEGDFTKSERYYFFPNLVSLERPNDVWSKDTDMNFSYKCGWLIQCKREGECFSPHFIQAILLRLAFSFTPKKLAGGTQDIETYDDSSGSEEEENPIKAVVIERLCSVWKNGIYWLEESGVKTVVEIINQSTLVLLMQCLCGCEIELIKRRSLIMSMVLSTKDEFCSKAELREYFLHRKVVAHPLQNLKEIQRFLFPFRQVEKSITEKNPCVINDQNEHIQLEELLYFEPYSELSRDVKKAEFTCILYKEQLSIFCGRKPPQGYDKQPSLSVRPRLHQLDLIKGNGKTVKVIRSTASMWKQLATRLYFEFSDISRIEADSHFQCRQACWQVCCDWLSGDASYYRKPTTWETLITALEEAELGEIAKDLEFIISGTSN